MNTAWRVRMAGQQAERLLVELGILETPVDPIEIAVRHGIVVEAKPVEAGGVSGMLLRHGDQFGILYATHVGGPGFQRFSIAHELGHYFLDGHCDQLTAAGPHVSRAGQGQADPFEQEADAFAAGLLMPGAFMSPLLKRRDLGLDLLVDLAATFGTSLVATAIRMAELGREPLSVVVSYAGVVEFGRMSEAMKPHARRGWLKRGDRVPVGSPTAVMSADRDAVARAGRMDRGIDIAEWYDCELPVPGREEVIGLGGYGRSLTMLTCRPAQGDDDDGEEADEAVMIESWTPRFRR